MAAIVLCAINARYTHSSLAMRSLLANLGPLRSDAVLVEASLGTRVEDLAERISAHDPQIVGLGAYIWNVRACIDLARVLRALLPSAIIVFGGPEMQRSQSATEAAEAGAVIVVGEGEQAFAQLCSEVLSGGGPLARKIRAPDPAPAELALPYELYDEEDIAHRVIYVETSRGCPYSCAFCMSALGRGVRYFDQGRLFEALSLLIQRGARRLKFVDRTFNLSTRRAVALLDFLAAQGTDRLFVHFEMVPDRLPAALVAAFERFGTQYIQLELGVQSMNPAVLERMGIRRDLARVEGVIRQLAGVGVHLHVDLIAGLPGECLESFKAGFDRLRQLGASELQLGILKRLGGTPLAERDCGRAMVFAEHPPYEVLATDALDFATLQRLKRLSYLWDRLGNSGNFLQTVLLLADGPSLFAGLLAFSDWVFEGCGQVHSIALDRLAGLVVSYLRCQGRDVGAIERAISHDYERNRRILPKLVRQALSFSPVRFALGSPEETAPGRFGERGKAGSLPARQHRHRPD